MKTRTDTPEPFPGLNGHVISDTTVHDDKYVVFKREDFENWLTDAGWQELPAIDDAVVIRRQDVFAGPALSIYASTIGIVASQHSDSDVRQRLLDISDYFARQAEAAYDESYKLPD